MRKLSLSEWAQIGELIGMIGVVLSLLMVVYSVNRNTVALQGETGNLIFERHMELKTTFMTDVSLAAIYVKKRSPTPELTDVESVRWDNYIFNLLDIWAMAHSRNQNGLLPPEEWVGWNTYFARVFSKDAEKLSRSDWEAWSSGYEADFWEHVAQSVF